MGAKYEGLEVIKRHFESSFGSFMHCRKAIDSRISQVALASKGLSYNRLTESKGELLSFLTPCGFLVVLRGERMLLLSPQKVRPRQTHEAKICPH